MSSKTSNTNKRSKNSKKTKRSDNDDVIVGSATNDNKEMTPNLAYNLNMFTSDCCHAFNIYEGSSCICSQCGRVINQLKEGELLTISVKFNENMTTNASGDIIETFREKAKRFATDPTYELCSKRCPKCNTLSRYARDAQNTIIFICSNSKCRNVFSS